MPPLVHIAIHARRSPRNIPLLPTRKSVRPQIGNRLRSQESMSSEKFDPETRMAKWSRLPSVVPQFGFACQAIKVGRDVNGDLGGRGESCRVMPPT